MKKLTTADTKTLKLISDQQDETAAKLDLLEKKLWAEADEKNEELKKLMKKQESRVNELIDNLNADLARQAEAVKETVKAFQVQFADFDR